MFGGFHFNMLGFNNQTFTLPVYLQIVGTSTGQTLAIHDEYDDDFLIYTYKVRRCSKTRSHDWTDCPYAHRGEKARRRDPRKYPYNGVACPEFRQTGDCRRGQNCEFAHGVFEFWLHPSRYRTRSCEAGLLCPRRICFFAHSPDQLRPEVIKDCFRCNPRGHVVNNGAIAGRRGSIFEPGLSSSSSSSQCMNAASYSGALDGGIGGGGGGGGGAVNAGEQEFDVPDIGWVMDLLE